MAFPETFFSSPAYLEPRRVRESFDRAAPGYAAQAGLQRHIGQRLLEYLDDHPALAPACVLDIGCGSGGLLPDLQRRFRRAQVYGVDLSPNMLREAAKLKPRWFSRLHLACADASRLPLPDACADLLVSNLMLQWCCDANAVFQEFARVLRPGGLLLFSSFGPATLQELRDSWAGVDNYSHINQFADMRDLGDAVAHAGLQFTIMESDRLIRHYPGAAALMRELKALGAHNVTQGRGRGLFGKNRWQQVQQAYEMLRQPAGLPATFEAVYGFAKGAIRQKPGEVKIPLSSLRRF